MVFYEGTEVQHLWLVWRCGCPYLQNFCRREKDASFCRNNVFAETNSWGSANGRNGARFADRLRTIRAQSTRHIRIRATARSLFLRNKTQERASRGGRFRARGRLLETIPTGRFAPEMAGPGAQSSDQAASPGSVLPSTLGSLGRVPEHGL